MQIRKLQKLSVPGPLNHSKTSSDYSVEFESVPTHPPFHQIAICIWVIILSNIDDIIPNIEHQYLTKAKNITADNSRMIAEEIRRSHRCHYDNRKYYISHIQQNGEINNILFAEYVFRVELGHKNGYYG